MDVLTVNAGSSSVRLAAFAAQEPGELVETRRASLNAGAEPRSELRMFLRDHHADDIAVVAHRIVHGGPRFTQPCVIDSAVTAEIERLAPLDCSLRRCSWDERAAGAPFDKRVERKEPHSEERR